MEFATSLFVGVAFTHNALHCRRFLRWVHLMWTETYIFRAYQSNPLLVLTMPCVHGKEEVCWAAALNLLIGQQWVTAQSRSLKIHVKLFTSRGRDSQGAILSFGHFFPLSLKLATVQSATPRQQCNRRRAVHIFIAKRCAMNGHSGHSDNSSCTCVREITQDVLAKGMTMYNFKQLRLSSLSRVMLMKLDIFFPFSFLFNSCFYKN